MKSVFGIPVNVLDKIKVYLRLETARNLIICSDAVDYWETAHGGGILQVTAENLHEFDHINNHMFVSNWVFSSQISRRYVSGVGYFPPIQCYRHPKYPKSYEKEERCFKAYLIAKFNPEAFKKLGGKLLNG
jgi:hypothetical protein